MDTLTIWQVDFFLTLSSSLGSVYHFFSKNFLSLYLLGILMKHRFWSIVIPFIVCLILNPKNLNVPLSCVPVLNLFFNFAIIFFWNKSFPLNTKSSTYITRISIKLPVALCQRNSALSYALTIPFWLVNSSMAHHLIHKCIFSTSIPVTMDICHMLAKEIFYIHLE